MKAKLYLVMALVAIAFCAAGCGCFQSKKGPPPVARVEPAPQPAVQPPPPQVVVVPQPLAPIPESVFFATNKSEITPEGAVILKNQAEWLKQNPNARIEISGNADQRAGEEYNQELGRKRADAVKGHLVDLGVNPDRLKTTSLGKNKPVCAESTEACYAANRRVDLSVIG